MSQLIRHIAGVPTATEQRCVRCCELIVLAERHSNPIWPGAYLDRATLRGKPGGMVDCTPVDLCPRYFFGEATKSAEDPILR